MTRTIRILSLPVLALIFALWILPGLIGRDPWKADEPYTVGIVDNMIRTGDWVVPTLTGEPFLEKPPLYFITAAGFGSLFSPPLELHEASRLATAFWMLLALLFLGLAAKELYGGQAGPLAAVLLLGCVHLQVTAHKLVTDAGLVAGISLALYGFSLSLRRRTAGGFWIGTGTGIGFLTKGLLAPGVLGMTALILPILFPRWRRREYALSLVFSLVVMLPFLFIWPVALYERSPDFFLHWFWHQNVGRFLGFNTGDVGFSTAAPDSHGYYVLNLLWLGWPVVLPAGWALWRFRRSWREHPAFELPLIVFLAMLAILSASSTNRALYALPLLLPLCLLAVPGVQTVPEKWSSAANRSVVLFFGVTALLLWLGWLTLMTGYPTAIARRIQELQPDYVPSLHSFLVTVAVFYSAAWVFVVVRITRSPEYAAVNWTLGVVLSWALIMTLWLPALNTGSSYRAIFTSLKRALPGSYTCVASRGVGESERAMLEYFAGLQTRRVEAFGGTGDCDLLIEQRSGKAQDPPETPGWTKVREFRHPSVRPKDIFTLYENKEVRSRLGR